MARQRIIAGNWKMNGSRASINALLSAVKAGSAAITGVEWIVFPPFVFLEQVAQLLTNSVIAWGGQNVGDAEAGAYTGEIAAGMLRELGCRYVLIGHSERRSLYGETDAILAKKFVLAQQAGLCPILCVGETEQEREQGLTQKVIQRQLDAVLALAPRAQALAQAIVAYEPVWAIGTGKTATPEVAQAVHAGIRQHIAINDDMIAQRLPILYGGSVKASNAADLFAMPDIDGGLIGGASLQADEFLQIGRALLG